MIENMTEEEMLDVNCSSQINRKAMKRAGQDKRHIMEFAGKSQFVLIRYHNDNMINRWISTPIAVSEQKSSLVGFCRKLYGSCIEFDDKDRSQSVETDMGESYFCVESVASV